MDTSGDAESARSATAAEHIADVARRTRLVVAVHAVLIAAGVGGFRTLRPDLWLAARRSTEGAHGLFELTAALALVGVWPLLAFQLVRFSASGLNFSERQRIARAGWLLGATGFALGAAVLAMSPSFPTLGTPTWGAWYVDHYWRNTARLAALPQFATLWALAITLARILTEGGERPPGYGRLAFATALLLVPVYAPPLALWLFAELAAVVLRRASRDAEPARPSALDGDRFAVALRQAAVQLAEQASARATTRPAAPERPAAASRFSTSKAAVDAWLEAAREASVYPLPEMALAAHHARELLAQAETERLEKEFPADQVPVERAMLAHCPTDTPPAIVAGMETIVDWNVSPVPAGPARAERDEPPPREFLRACEALVDLLGETWLRWSHSRQGHTLETPVFARHDYADLDWTQSDVERLRSDPPLDQTVMLRPGPRLDTRARPRLREYLCALSHWNRRAHAEPARVAVELAPLFRVPLEPLVMSLARAAWLTRLWAAGWLLGERTVGYLAYLACCWPIDVENEAARRLLELNEGSLAAARRECSTLNDWAESVFEILPIYHTCQWLYAHVKDPEERDRRQRFVEERWVDTHDVLDNLKRGREWFWTAHFPVKSILESDAATAVREVRYHCQARVSYPEYWRDLLARFAREGEAGFRARRGNSGLWCPDEVDERIAKWRVCLLLRRLGPMTDPGVRALRRWASGEVGPAGAG